MRRPNSVQGDLWPSMEINPTAEHPSYAAWLNRIANTVKGNPRFLRKGNMIGPVGHQKRRYENYEQTENSLYGVL
jgi:hypothetical protein